MRCNKKSGITLVSLVLYLTLFTVFTVFVSGISSNMNERLFNDRGEAINYTSLNKLQYNIENSALNSYDIIENTNKISFSNGDYYTYDNQNKVIYKNEGILCLNVESCDISVEVFENAKKLTLNVSFNKYMNNISKTIIACVEGI